MDYRKLSTSALKELHAACDKAYKSDRAGEAVTSAIESYQGKHFGVDEFSDWNRHVRKIEAELSARDEAFDPIELR